MSTKQFTHLDKKGNPSMVNVSPKKSTLRVAKAKTIVRLPNEVISQFNNNELITAKGPVFQTAIIAGIMGAKKTSELIPLCHPLSLDHCSIAVQIISDTQIEIICTAEITSKTGVEMEALAGASVAALTIYDMCKAFSQDITIEQTQLIEKTGGKNDFKRA